VRRSLKVEFRFGNAGKRSWDCMIRLVIALSVVFCTTTDPDDYQADSDEERDFHAEEAGVLTGRWMRERDAIPAAEVLLPPEKVRIQANLVARSSDSQLRTCYGRTQTQQEWMSGG